MLVPIKSPYDWFRIIQVDLLRAGISQNYIAAVCGRDIVAVNYWTRSGEPKHSDAELVLALHKQHCPEKHEEYIAANKVAWKEVSHIQSKSDIRLNKRRVSTRGLMDCASNGVEIND